LYSFLGAMMGRGEGVPGFSIAAIFFDLDITLCAPTVPFREVFGDVVAPLLQRRSELTLTDLLHLWGEALLQPGPSTTAGCFRRVLGACGIAQADDLVGEFAAGLNARWAASQALTPAAEEVLQRLGATWPLGLITNGPSDAQRVVVDALDLASAFHWLLVSGDADVGIRKPDPAIFAHAARLAGCPPGALLYVGDSAVNDVAGAAAAGWRTCWLHASAVVPPTEVPLADLVISTLAELPALVDLAKSMPQRRLGTPSVVGSELLPWRTARK